MRAASLFDLTLRTEINDILDASIGEAEISKNMYGDDNGNLYFPIGANSPLENFNKDDYSFERDWHYEDESGYTEERSFITSALSNDIKTFDYDLDNPNFDISKFLHTLALSPDFYGCLIKDNDKSDFLINPLHPLTALSIKLGQIKLPKNGKVIVFEFSESYKRVIENSNLGPAYSDMMNILDFDNTSALLNSQIGNALPANIKNNADALNNFFNLKNTWINYIKLSPYFVGKMVTERVLNVDREDYFNQLTYIGEIKNLKEIGDVTFTEKILQSEKPKFLVIPLQAMVSSVATPYYGISIVNKPTTDNISGFNAGIMLSGNIKSRNYGETGSVCTGSMPSTNATGWLTLNRVNISSMWYSEIINTNNHTLLINHIMVAKSLAGKFYDLNIPDSSTNNEDNEN